MVKIINKMKQRTMKVQSIAPGQLVIQIFIASQRVAPSHIFLVPYLASRCEVTSEWRASSYLMRVWPGGWGHQVVTRAYS